MAGIENLFSVQDEYIILLYKYEAPKRPSSEEEQAHQSRTVLRQSDFLRTQSGISFTGLGPLIL